MTTVYKCDRCFFQGSWKELKAIKIDHLKIEVDLCNACLDDLEKMMKEFMKGKL